VLVNSCDVKFTWCFTMGLETKLSWEVSCFVHTMFQDIIHEKDGKHKDLHKKMADIRREHDEVKRIVSYILQSMVDL